MKTSFVFAWSRNVSIIVLMGGDIILLANDQTAENEKVLQNLDVDCITR